MYAKHVSFHMLINGNFGIQQYNIDRTDDIKDTYETGQGHRDERDMNTRINKERTNHF